MGKLSPIEFEILSHRIYSIMNEARQGVMRVSGSPVVCEAGECLFAAYTAEGYTSVTACGLMLHTVGSQGFIQKIIADQSEHPGIFEGDMFFFNDPLIGGIHASDQAILAPLFYKGQLYGWLGSLTHTPESGAIEPGGMPPSSRSLLHEGFRIEGQKIVVGGKLNPPVVNTIKRAVRDPGFVMLDVHAKIAGLNIGKARMHEMTERYGINTMREVLQGMIDQSADLARAKLRELQDGTWRTIMHGDHNCVDYKHWKVEISLTKKGEELTIDFTGTSPENTGPLNCMLPGTTGSCFVAIASQLFHETMLNYGLMVPVKIIAPEGSMVNVGALSPCCMCPPYPGCSVSAGVTQLIAKMFFTRRKFHGDINSCWSTNMIAPFFGGVNQYGITTGSMFFDCFAGGTGAGVDRDGVNTGAAQMNMESNIADCETNEMVNPVMYLWRRESKDSGGPGMYRGGSGLSFCQVAHNTPALVFGQIGLGSEVSTTPSLCGGYPAGSVKVIAARHINSSERFAKGEVPYSLEDIYNMYSDDVQELPPQSPSAPHPEGSIWAVDSQVAGGGLGDPLDRDPALVKVDLEDGYISERAARELYCVVLDPKSGEVDYKATGAARNKVKEERRARGKVWKEEK
ncbi:MAG: Acetophenone carboxylase delta subunit [Pelotomaculum sp. PtaU1.Bin035]|nr:MAG: Acetophenone carboxylase delta subunit [Pelotomaculum sp. PtaU1.Bin035]